tara:strand:+ start:196 stop:387 length:192 start_codon:yes stop_codon:yes gene_type:complete
MLVEYKAGKSRQPALVTTLTSIPRQQKSPTIEGRLGWIQCDETRPPGIGNNPHQHSKRKKAPP